MCRGSVAARDSAPVARLSGRLADTGFLPCEPFNTARQGRNGASERRAARLDLHRLRLCGGRPGDLGAYPVAIQPLLWLT
jgi:hypothetical protein